MAIRGVTTVELSQANGPTAGPRLGLPGFPFQDLYNLGALSESFPQGSSVPWDYRASLSAPLATGLVLDSSLQAPSAFEVLFEGVSALVDFGELVASAISSDIFGGVEAAASLYQDVNAFLSDTGDKISYKKGSFLLAYPHPQYDHVSVRFKADSDDDGMALAIGPNFPPNHPLAQAVTVQRDDNINDLHFQATVAIDLLNLRAVLAENAFGTLAQPAALVVGFAIREKHGTFTTLQVAHALCLNLRSLQAAPRTARTTVFYSKGTFTGVDPTSVQVGQQELASFVEGQSDNVQTVPLELVHEQGGFSINGAAYDQVLVKMEAHSPRVKVGFGAAGAASPDNLPVATTADTLPQGIPGIVVTPAPQLDSIDSDPFGRQYQAQGDASAAVSFSPGVAPLVSPPVTLVFATEFGRPGALLTVMQNVQVRRMLGGVILPVTATAAGTAT